MGVLIYGGTGRGVIAITEGNGAGWQINERRCLPEWEITELVMGPSDLLIAGTRGDGVWRQVDDTWEGRTGGWKKPSYGRRGPGKVHCVTVDPEDPDTIYAGTEPIGIWVTHDGGENWAALEGILTLPNLPDIGYPVPSVEPHVRDLTIDPKNPDVIYAALQVGYIAKSTDRGKTWRLLTEGIDADVHTLIIHPEDSDTILATTGGHGHRRGETEGRALYVSHDAGKSWSPMAMEFEQDYAVAMAMHPENPDILFTAVANGPPRWQRPTGAEALLIASKDGGKNWYEVETGFEGIGPEFPGAISFDPASPDDVYVCTHRGNLLRSRNGGNDWEHIPLDLAGFGGLAERGLSDMKILHT